MRRVVTAAALAIAAAGGVPAAAAAAPTVTGPDAVVENAGNATYTVSIGPAPVGETVTVSVAPDAGATAGADFGSPAPASIDFAASLSGQSAQVNVPIVDDDADEPDTEAFVVTASDMTGSGNKRTTITDNDTTIDVSPAAGSLTEGGAATFTLTPRGPVDHPMSVQFATAPQSAGSADYTDTSGTVDWPAFSSDARTITIQTTQDAVDEDDEAFGLFLKPVGGAITTTAVPVTIADDDPPPLVAAVARRFTEGSSGTHRESILVGLSGPSAKTVSVSYATRDGTAAAPSDYTGATGRLTFAPGETAKAVTVSINGDKTAEDDEVFVLELSDPVNATLVGQGGAAMTIGDDDGGGNPLGAVTGPTPGGGAPRDVTDPRIRLARLTGHGSRMFVALTCPKGELSCAGTVTLFSVATRKRPEHRLARARFKLKGGAQRRLTLRISKSGRSLLRRAHRLKVRAYAVAEDAAGNVGTTAASATLHR